MLGALPRVFIRTDPDARLIWLLVVGDPAVIRLLFNLPSRTPADGQVVACDDPAQSVLHCDAKGTNQRESRA
jgi:hypothetical protein